jgi:hypothetical protein
VPAGTLHAPGTALTIELQEDSDVFSMWQARIGEFSIPKELLFKDITKEDRERLGERAALGQVDWATSGDPQLYANRHTPPVIEEDVPEGREEWIFYNTEKFSGKRLTVAPGKRYASKDAGVYSLFVWRGKGTVDGHAVEGQSPGLDELLVTHAKAASEIAIVNTGSEPLEVLKFFGKGLNADCPRLPSGRSGKARGSRPPA